MGEYKVGVYNEDGYILSFPNVSDEVRQSHPVEPYAESSTRLFPVGTIAKQGENEFVYCRNGDVALTVGAPIQQCARAHLEQDYDVDVYTTYAIGVKVVGLVSTENLDDEAYNALANDFAEGYLMVNAETGAGQMYKIKANEAFSGTATILFTLYDPLITALSTTSDVSLVRNPYYRVIATTAPLSGMFVGVPLIGVTASTSSVGYWFWAKIKGPAPVKVNAACALGTPCVVGKTAATSDPMTTASTTEIVIGYPMTLIVSSGDYQNIFLTG